MTDGERAIEEARAEWQAAQVRLRFVATGLCEHEAVEQSAVYGAAYLADMNREAAEAASQAADALQEAFEARIAELSRLNAPGNRTQSSVGIGRRRQIDSREGGTLEPLKPSRMTHSWQRKQLHAFWSAWESPPQLLRPCCWHAPGQ